MKKILLLIIIILCIVFICIFDGASAKAEKSKTRITAHLCSTGRLSWKNVSNVEIKNNVVKFLDLDDGSTYTLVNMMTCIRESNN